MSDKNATETMAADASGIAQAAAILKSGELVAVPTETVYGLAARADCAAAVAKIYAAKGRPDFNPLIVHVASLEMAHRIAKIDDRAITLADKFWPGPLTLVLPMRDDAPVAKAVSAGLPTIALRQSAHPAMQALLGQLGLPLAAPSANRSEHISPTQVEHVRGSLGDHCPAVLDGGRCEQGLESTIVALRPEGGWSLLRQGPVTADEITQLLGAPQLASESRIQAPGQMARHYSPGKSMRLNCEEPGDNDFMIGFGAKGGDANLSADGDLMHAAARLYECLHLAEASDQPNIAIAPIPETGVGAAINDRLRRAATLPD
ncbi:MAG: L-threonylcarbamoyladenylate synthase [Erythrobacter sp.]